MQNKPIFQTYMGGAIFDENEVYIFAQIDELNDQEIDHTKILRWKNDSWAHYMIDWPVVSICAVHSPHKKIISMGLNGEIHIAESGAMQYSEIDGTSDGPMHRGVMRELRTIAGIPYAVGMQYQVYAMTRSSWSRLDKDIVLPKGTDEVKSFDSIDGFSPSELYAVGLDGIFSTFDGSRWSSIDSPTSVSLEKVFCAPDKNVYIGGNAGTIIVGNKSTWKVIPDDILDGTIWDIAWFADKVFFSTLDGLYSLQNNVLKKEIIKKDGFWSYGSLVANDKVLWSIGRKSLAKTKNGIDWEEVICDHTDY